MPKIICLLVLLATAAIAAAQTYKWKDANGTIQYSDTPPPSNARDVQQLRKSSGPAPATSSASGTAQPKPASDAEAEFRKRMTARQDAEAKQAKAQEEEEIRARHCERARLHMAALESGNRMARYTEAGERITIDDAERETQKAEAQKAIQVWCK